MSDTLGVVIVGSFPPHPLSCWAPGIAQETNSILLTPPPAGNGHFHGRAAFLPTSFLLRTDLLLHMVFLSFSVPTTPSGRYRPLLFWLRLSPRGYILPPNPKGLLNIVR